MLIFWISISKVAVVTVYTKIIQIIGTVNNAFYSKDTSAVWEGIVF